MQPNKKVLVVGAGPAGLAAAALFASEPNTHVEVHEQSAASTRPGSGITLRTDVDVLGLGPQLDVFALDGRCFLRDGVALVDLPRPKAAGLVALPRAALIDSLLGLCLERGVKIHYERRLEKLSAAVLVDLDLIVAADGVHSAVRDDLIHECGAKLTYGRNHYVWLSVDRAFPKLTLASQSRAGAMLAWLYGYDPSHSTMIVEAPRQQLLEHGLLGCNASECQDVLESLFEETLAGARIVKTKHVAWSQFPVVSCERLSSDKVVLLGDAGHTTHFSQGFGTLFALEDAIALHRAIAQARSIGEGLAAFEAEQLPRIGEFQRVSLASMHWSEAVCEALGRRDESSFAQLVEARWPNNEVVDAPLVDRR